MTIDIAEIRHTGERALLRVGATSANAKLQLDLLLHAEAAGHVSHGLLRLPRLVRRIKNGAIDPVTLGKQEWISSSHLQVDGERGLGPVVAIAAIDAASDRARQNGVALVTIRDSNHLGMLAWYAEQIAQAGQVGLLLTISEALVHPWGGRHAMIGTNPIAIGVPAQPKPFVMDMATSLVSMGKIHDHANRGADIPTGWALDEDGAATTDAKRAMNGAIAPFGGAKGYALGLAFEVLVGSLCASALGRDVVGTLDDTMVCNKGDVIIIMEPAKGALEIVSQYLAAVRATAPIDPTSPVMVPGDRAAVKRQQSAAMNLDLDIWNQIVALAEH